MRQIIPLMDGRRYEATLLSKLRERTQYWHREQKTIDDEYACAHVPSKIVVGRQETMTSLWDYMVNPAREMSSAQIESRTQSSDDTKAQAKTDKLLFGRWEFKSSVTPTRRKDGVVKPNLVFFDQYAPLADAEFDPRDGGIKRVVRTIANNWRDLTSDMLHLGTPSKLGLLVPRDRDNMMRYMDICTENGDADSFSWWNDETGMKGHEFERLFELVQSPVIEPVTKLLEVDFDIDKHADAGLSRRSTVGDGIRPKTKPLSIASSHGHVTLEAPSLKAMQREERHRTSKIPFTYTLGSLEEYIVTTDDAAVAGSSLSQASSQHFAEAIFTHVVQRFARSTMS